MAATANRGHHHLSNLIQPEEHFNSLFTIGFLFLLIIQPGEHIFTIYNLIIWLSSFYLRNNNFTNISVNTYAFGEIHACMLFMFYCMLVSQPASFTIVKSCGPKYWYYKFGSICPFVFAQNICSMSPKIFGRSFWYGLALYISCPSTSEEVKLTKDQMSKYRTI